MLHLIPFLNISLCLLKALLLLLSISAIIANDIPVAPEVLVDVVLPVKDMKAENTTVIRFQSVHPCSGKPCERAPSNTFDFENMLPGGQKRD